ncbi:MAG: amidophosphoribosyltransferase [Theionarchaea archaeon]|nr:amidophosphoribosyltransferase [Theionarchaea archaeon]MBU7037222.1 amidophosphoribosyltransferase [Theionarchaea archaeon]
MAGILGIYAFEEIWNVSRFLYYGLVAIQTRGEEVSTLAVGNDSAVAKGTADNLDVSPLKGYCGVAGAFTRNEGYYFDDGITVVYDGSIDVSRLVTQIKSGKEVEDCLADLDGAYALLLLKDNVMYAARDPYGIRPLCIGGIGFDMAVISSESSALDVIGAEYSRDIKPGEVVVVDQFYIDSLENKAKQKAVCAFEFVYFSRPDSQVFGKSVHTVRKLIGETLEPHDADAVIGVPETAIPFAMAYASKNGIPVDLGFVRTGRPTRTAIKPTQLERMIGVQLKLNPVRTAVAGKRVVLIDDSVVRGTTLRNTVSLLRRRGAKEVHVRIASPKLIAPCPYGVEVPTKDELIAVDNTEEEISRIVGADSFSYLKVEQLTSLIGMPVCTGCMTGEYPTEQGECCSCQPGSECPVEVSQ